MRMVCPSCGAMISADAAGNDAEARQCINTISQMPPSVARIAFAYIALFRPSSGRGLLWNKARRLADELYRMIISESVAVGSRAARPTVADMWRQAMERMIDNPPSNLPLKNHNYLVKIVYDLADAADRVDERDREERLKMRREMESGQRKSADFEPITSEDINNTMKRLKGHKVAS